MQADRRNTACHTSFHGHAIAEVISHSFLTTYGGVRSQGCPCVIYSRLHLKCDGTCTETRFHLSAKRASPFKSAGASVLSTTGSRGVRISGSNAGYTMFRGSVKSTGYPFHLPVSPSLPLPHVTVCHHISTALYTYYQNTHTIVKTPTHYKTPHTLTHRLQNKIKQPQYKMHNK